jgi:hypothetical protein
MLVPERGDPTVKIGLFITGFWMRLAPDAFRARLIAVLRQADEFQGYKKRSTNIGTAVFCLCEADYAM